MLHVFSTENHPIACKYKYPIAYESGSEAEAGPSQASKMESFETIVKSWKPLTIVINLSI